MIRKYFLYSSYKEIHLYFLLFSVWFFIMFRAVIYCEIYPNVGVRYKYDFIFSQMANKLYEQLQAIPVFMV